MPASQWTSQQAAQQATWQLLQHMPSCHAPPCPQGALLMLLFHVSHMLEGKFTATASSAVAHLFDCIPSQVNAERYPGTLHSQGIVKASRKAQLPRWTPLLSVIRSASAAASQHRPGCFRPVWSVSRGPVPLNIPGSHRAAHQEPQDPFSNHACNVPTVRRLVAGHARGDRPAHRRPHAGDGSGGAGPRCGAGRARARAAWRACRARRHRRVGRRVCRHGTHQRRGAACGDCGRRAHRGRQPQRGRAAGGARGVARGGLNAGAHRAADGAGAGVAVRGRVRMFADRGARAQASRCLGMCAYLWAVKGGRTGWRAGRQAGEQADGWVGKVLVCVWAAHRVELNP
eukprot:356647-Chlamydomonas_euryale.AAC.10